MNPSRHPTTEARALVVDALRQVVPDADFEELGDDRPFRAALELDSLDFLAFVERLSSRAGVRIDESDYASLTTITSATEFVAAAR